MIIFYTILYIVRIPITIEIIIPLKINKDIEIINLPGRFKLIF